MEISKSIYKGVVEPYYKNLLGQISTVLVIAGKIEDTLPCHRLTLQWARALASAGNNNYI